MVKFFMEFFDVVFPLNIGPLTYRRPSGYNGPITPGMFVKAEIKKSIRHGVVLRETTHSPEGPVKEIIDVLQDKSIFSSSMVNLIGWMAEYYLATEGLVLKSMLPKEVFERIGQSKKRESIIESHKAPVAAHPIDTHILSTVRESISRKEYKTYLLHVPTIMHEISYLLDIVKGVGNIIILVPEMAYIEEVLPAMHELAGERLTILHGKLSRAQRRHAFHRIISGDSDIVLGTRLAVFAPLRSPRLIAVLQEQNRSYKNLEGLRYHGRDVAVMRGYLEKATVVLSSACPSLESFYNTVIGKYSLLKPEVTVKRPKVEIINMKTAKKVTPHLSKRAMDAAASCIRKKENALFLLNRKGYSIIQCAECNYIERCPECRIPLVYHKDKRFLKCHYCGRMQSLTDTCKRCNGSRFVMIGAGTQRISAEIEKYLHIKPLLLDKDMLKENPALKGLNNIVPGEEMIVSTKVVIGRLSHMETLDLCVFLNPDINLHLPDFRSAELLFQEIFIVSEYIKPEGLLLIQTRMPENYVFKYIKNYNLADLFREELSMRRSLSYPPFSRMILVTIASRADIGNKLMRVLTLNENNPPPPPFGKGGMGGFSEGEKVEVIGPVRITKNGTSIWKLLLKSPSKERLNSYIRNFLKNLEKEKGLKIVVDVDPIAI